MIFLHFSDIICSNCFVLYKKNNGKCKYSSCCIMHWKRNCIVSNSDCKTELYFPDYILNTSSKNNSTRCVYCYRNNIKKESKILLGLLF